MDIIPVEIPVPKNEKERLAKLHSYNIIGSHDKTGTFRHVVSMAACIFNVPVALVNFVDETRVVTEANVGVESAGDIGRDISLCSMAILRDEVTVFKNAREEECLLTNPVVHGKLGIQFYAAAPLKTPDGFHIGVVAVADKKPREFSKDEEKILEGLAAIVMEELEERMSISS